MKGERISREKGDPHAWICICGNTPGGAGFDTCDAEGNFLEPSRAGSWNGLYRCDTCGRIIDQDTLEVVGRTAQ